jgi:hypothetical protein
MSKWLQAQKDRIAWVILLGVLISMEKRRV